ncbi:cobalt ECF transporter T component CbiQ [Rhodovulum sp. BSW8]|uniref:Cobalt/nickel transport system permease protein n=1 Tax=Rhodovulum visakhapatnamense TaxID=364297 RepID=A0A4R8FQ59_9RHOB|nr:MULTISPECIES: cobalt ECF transporter T component CbiQ [Rhodovulum]RBO51904.1 cobalt ECF transporter T component CbiQ [Rhodovulum sp. BSW8]TDX28591.1 cobalt/nickel transport system permease protein [Rhodovulum visakhapatnamense]
MSDILMQDRAGPEGAALDAIDPRARLIGAAGFACVTVACSWLPLLLAALILAIAVMVLSGRAVGPTLRRMAAMDGFIFLLIAMLPFTTPGDPVFTLWGFAASREGIVHSAEILLTANAVVLALLSLAGTLEPAVMGQALHRLGTPERLVHLLLFTIRYIEVLRAEHLRLRRAMKVRGFRPGTSWHTYRSLGYLVGMLLVRAVERSERVLAAMKCRGFSGRMPVLSAFAYGPRDAVFGAGLGAVLIAMIAAEVAHGAF